MRILVTGATGYVGSRLVAELVTAGHQVLTATRDPARLARMGWFDDVTPVSLDASDAESVHAAFDAAGRLVDDDIREQLDEALSILAAEAAPVAVAA